MKMNVHNKDGGFSLVELIVVILIMGVLAAGATISFMSVYNADVERAGKKISALMSIARSKALALENDSYYIKTKVYKVSNGDYYAGVYKVNITSGAEELLEPAQEERISNYRVSLSIGKKNKSDQVALDDIGDSVEYVFKKTTGGLASVAVNGGTPLTIEDDMYKDLILSGADECWLIIVPATGRCYVK